MSPFSAVNECLHHNVYMYIYMYYVKPFGLWVHSLHANVKLPCTCAHLPCMHACSSDSNSNCAWHLCVDDGIVWLLWDTYTALTVIVCIQMAAHVCMLL